ncbi:MAG: fatty acid desaturase family protein [Myxococcota bacterium]
MKINQVLNRDEIKRLTSASDVQGTLSVATSLALIAAAFALAARWPSILTVAAALLLLGGRQLALAVLTHECAHRSLFASRRANEIVGTWLGALVWLPLARYRTHHLGHHAHAGSSRDPDLGLARGFPVTAASMSRKILRDLTGIAGIKRIAFQFLMDAGLYNYTASDYQGPDRTRRSIRQRAALLVENFGPVLVANGLLAALLLAFGAGWLYGLWIGAYLTTYSLFLRLRGIAEHACTDEVDDPIGHTRTTYTNLLERLTLAPHHVNYHAEHHLLPTAPHYRLAEVHRLLKERGAFEHGHIAPNYFAVLRQVTSLNIAAERV